MPRITETKSEKQAKSSKIPEMKTSAIQKTQQIQSDQLSAAKNETLTFQEKLDRLATKRELQAEADSDKLAQIIDPNLYQAYVWEKTKQKVASQGQSTNSNDFFVELEAVYTVDTEFDLYQIKSSPQIELLTASI